MEADWFKRIELVEKYRMAPTNNPKDQKIPLCMTFSPFRRIERSTVDGPFLQIRLAMNVERVIRNSLARLRPLPPDIRAFGDFLCHRSEPDWHFRRSRPTFYCSVALTCSGRRVACRSRLSQQVRLPLQPPLSSPLRELASVFRESPQKGLQPFATVLGAETVSGAVVVSLSGLRSV